MKFSTARGTAINNAYNMVTLYHIVPHITYGMVSTTGKIWGVSPVTSMRVIPLGTVNMVYRYHIEWFMQTVT
jgi:hypothetical protein